MDPISAVGFVSAIAGIVDLIAKGVLSLSDFQSRYRIVDLKVSLLIGQLSTLKNALQCRTTLEQRDMLRARESRHVLDLARDETSSLRLLIDIDSGDAGSFRSARTEDLETVHAQFDFDSQVFNSRAYRVATRANMIDALTDSRRRGISHSTHISGGPPQNTSDSKEASQETSVGIAITTAMDVLSETDRSLVRAADADSELPDFMIHTPDTLGRLTIQMGQATRVNKITPSLEGQALPPIKGLAHDGISKPSPHLWPLLRARQQLATRVRTWSKAMKPMDFNVVILGVSESGKSTLVKAARAGHGDIDEPWRRLHIDTIFSNTIISLRWLTFMTQRKIQEGGFSPQPRSLYDTFTAGARFIGELESVDSPRRSLEAIAPAAKALWNHPYVDETFKRSGTEQLQHAQGTPWDLPSYLPDCAEHFLNSIERIFKSDYLPSIEDIMWAHTRTTGSWKWQFLIDGTNYHFCDVGGMRSERKKWVEVFQDVNMMVFTLDVSCYHQALNEDLQTNRMSEQFTLWEAIANSRWFTGTRIVVLLTKKDKLTPDRLKRHPFKSQFGEYNGSPERAEDIIKYIVWRLDGLRKGILESSTNPFAKGIAWIEGQLTPLSEARIPLLDQGFLHSDLTYDVPSVWDGRFFRLDDHITRLEASCSKLRLRLPLRREEVKKTLVDMVVKSGIRDAFVELIVTRGVRGVRGQKLEDLSNNLYMFIMPFIWVMEPEMQYNGGSAIIARTVRRVPPGAIDPTVKNLQWGDLTRAMFEAVDRGATHPFLTDGDGNLTEGSGFNICIVKDGTIYTPDRGVLEGVTRKSVFDAAKVHDIPVRMEVVPVETAYQCDEIFMCTTAGGIMPITSLDGQPVKGGKVGPITKKIWDTYWAMHYDSAYSFEIDYSAV
ncbi:hypothetical protein LA080_012038 [Diaporthe eres]|nr:hypothetical protein LA080_012038 [Diaporthe eres]